MYKKYFLMNVILLDDMKVENPEKFILTIYSGTEQLYFSLYNPKKIGSFYFKELPEEGQVDTLSVLKETLLNNDFFTLPFRKVLIMSRTSSFAFIPNVFYKEKNEENFMSFINSGKQGITMNHTITNIKSKVLFKLPEDTYNLSLRLFSNPIFIHYSEPFIKYLIGKSKNFKNRQMIVNLKEMGLDIFCFSKNTFLLGNYFQCKNIQEALYFILFTWKQLQFNQSDDALYISGETSFSNVLRDKLAIYLQQIYRLDFPSANHFEGIETSKIPIELAMLSVCGL